MALFESRKADKATEEKTKRSRPTRRVLDSVDDMRRRARHRLIGACLLVLTAIVIFPLLFDTEPRPLPVNAQVSVVGRDSVPSLHVSSQVPVNRHGLADDEEVVDTSVASAAVTVAAPVQSAPTERSSVVEPKPNQEATSLAAQRAQEARAQSQRAQAEAAKPATPAATQTAQTLKPAESRPSPAAAPVAAVPPPPAARAPAAAVANNGAEAARARALLEGRPVETAAAPASRSDQGRFIVQVGAFSDDAKVREIKQKLEAAGLKTYTQVVQTSAGRATRVRVGPFANRADADRAAERVKGVNLPAAIMSM